MAWKDILNQEIAKQVFQSHLEQGQVAGAYLLAGPEGVGKLRLAMEMAKALVCTGAEARPCDACASCRQAMRQAHLDIHVVRPEGAAGQIKIEAIRHLLGRLALRPFSAATQVAVLDGAERLTEEAANSLLKTLEEPSRTTRFLLTTVRVSQCIPTIVSRCQLVRCHPLPAEAIAHVLGASGSIDAQTAQMIARLCGGSASRAIELAGRWASYRQGLERLASDDPTAWFAQPLPESRQEVAELLDGALAWLRDVTVAATAEAVSIAHSDYAGPIRRDAARVDVNRCLDTAFSLIALRESIEQFVNPRLIAALTREKWLLLTSPR